ncbi:3-hydroxybutyrate dehydrogenase [Roseospira marina]|uniref:3-hydroxybutyrate dehydrogenase n=1 Tax=Roseospira marina TaxID=140057 RepID=A0A5M6IAK0_9PROT|nr:3-hydroxybutyrate dehydrogenase [Roseospira marina]KAA5604749.1 3-hydroxybutyrate dehydrogenase [Roseospira marina]MBB4313426.1 3-hydroxybutyrate dehydrogenase [Roseospira marina]MBB5086588.1 3-hydroxybutyrate dehydrogenase [Roseospira marina]
MLNGKTALVTGSTSGIGLGIARAMAAKGANVALNGFGDPDEIEAIRAGLEADHGVKAVFVHADLSNPDEAFTLIRKVEKDLAPVDILVNNAGIQHTDRIEDFPPEKWDAVIAINLSACFHTTRAALPGMQARNWGRIINIASAHGLVGSPFKAAYIAAKHGLVGLTKVTALENAKTHITANAICPGWVKTPLVVKQIEDRAKAEGLSVEDATRTLLGERQPTERFVTPEQLGELAVFLSSEAADTTTGAAFPMDGAFTTW